MKYVILPPQDAPKKETVHHRPKTLGEMKLAFLNANNRKNWADDELIPEIPTSRVFTSRKKFVKALQEQNQLLRMRERERFTATLHTAPSRLEIGILASRAAALALMNAPSALTACEYFTRRVQLIDAFMEEELAQYVYDPEALDILKYISPI